MRLFVRCMVGASVGGLLLVGATIPAAAQEASAVIARAQKTLDEIARLIDGILMRQALRSSSARSRGESPAPEGWVSLFDGKSLAGWEQTDFLGGGAVRLQTSFEGGPPAVVIEAGSQLSGINRIGDPPKSGYEIALDFMKIKGDDFACGLTFPVGDSHATLVLGGWGGMVIGISSIDGADASENETTKSAELPPGRWFHVRVRVTPAKLQAWLDEKQIVDLALANRRISLRPGPIFQSKPLGIATYQTSAAFRGIMLRRIGAR